ncbi:MAG TPA: hypothetical protein VFU86_22175 [Terriglobales bacterium]|nr:hypothetical protein [Terriglobales bacterium]
MHSENLICFPLHHPDSFGPEINRQILATSEFRRLLFAAIAALPYIEDQRRGVELKEALCELIAPDLQED